MARKKQRRNLFQRSGVSTGSAGLPPGIQLAYTLKGHTDGIGGISWSPDGRLLASSSRDRTVRLWDVKSEDCIRTLEGHALAVNCVVFNPAGKILASGGEDGCVHLWDVDTGISLGSLFGHEGPIHGLAFDTEGRTLASACEDKLVKVWDVSSRRLLRTLRGHREAVLSVVFDGSSRTIASGSADRTVRLWDAGSGRLLRTLGGLGPNVFSLSFNPSERDLLACGSWDGNLKLLDTRGTEPPRIFEGHTAGVGCVAYLPDGVLVASKGSQGDDTIRVWESSSGNCLAVIPEPGSLLGSAGLVACPTRPTLASVGADLGTPIAKPFRKTLRDSLIHIWDLDVPVLLGRPPVGTVSYTSAKVVLVGESNVGKSYLAHRIATGAPPREALINARLAPAAVAPR